VEALAGHACIVYGRGGQVKTWEFNDVSNNEAPVRRMEHAPTSRLCFDDLQMIKDATQAGIGLARLPTWLLSDALRDGSLVQLFEEPHPFGYPLNIVWPHTRYLPLKTRVVVDLMLQKLPPLLIA
jgi:DNA-binding transcriptional LysR family regulator